MELLKYPAAKPKLHLYRVEIPSGDKIPLLTHTAPMMFYMQGVSFCSLINTCDQPDGTEIKTEFKPDETFVEVANEPHYVELLEKSQLLFGLQLLLSKACPQQSSSNESI